MVVQSCSERKVGGRGMRGGSWTLSLAGSLSFWLVVCLAWSLEPAARGLQSAVCPPTTLGWGLPCCLTPRPLAGLDRLHLGYVLAGLID